MTRVVLSIGSNLGDRLARLQSVPDRLGDAVRAISPVYETAAWGGVEQGPFLNAVLTVAGGKRPVTKLRAELDPADRASVQLTGLVLTLRGESTKPDSRSDAAPGT